MATPSQPPAGEQPQAPHLHWETAAEQPQLQPVQPQPERSAGALNELLALAFRTEPERAREIRHALHFLTQEAQHNPSSARQVTDLDILARRLIALHAGERRRVAFAHCDLSGAHADPLFLRPALLSAVRDLVGHGEGLLLVSGLKAAVTGGKRRFSETRRQSYQQTQSLIEALVAKFAPPRMRLHLIII